MLDPEERKIKQDRLINEYHILENRVQNDSMIAYTFAAALIAAGFGLLSLVLSRVSQKNIGFSDLVVDILLAAVPPLLIAAASYTLNRMNMTGQIRVARAIQLENALGFFSFRLFPPWNKDLPPGFELVLGQQASGSLWDGSEQQKAELEKKGREFLAEVGKRSRLSKALTWLSKILFAIAFIVLVWIIASLAFHWLGWV